MGDFTDYLTKGGKNGAAGKAIPIGSTHYEMAGVSFYLQSTPKEILSQLVQAMIQQLAQQGQHEAANQMLQNPQPFYGSPQAMAVFMAASVELEKRDERIEKLETAVAGLADVLRSVAREQGGHGHSNETFIPAIDAAMAGLAPKEAE